MEGRRSSLPAATGVRDRDSDPNAVCDIFLKRKQRDDDRFSWYEGAFGAGLYRHIEGHR
jgi:hypothetical protein